MPVRTQGDEIALGSIAGLASALNVADLQPAQGTASLAALAILFEDLLVQPVVGTGSMPVPKVAVNSLVGFPTFSCKAGLMPCRSRITCWISSGYKRTLKQEQQQKRVPPGQIISKYEQKKRGVSAACVSPCALQIPELATR